MVSGDLCAALFVYHSTVSDNKLTADQTTHHWQGWSAQGPQWAEGEKRQFALWREKITEAALVSSQTGCLFTAEFFCKV